MQDLTARAWDRHAPTYSQLFAPLTGFIARSMVTLAAPRLPLGARVLDIACGSGAVTLPAVERARAERHAGGPGGLVVGCDLSPAMVELTRAAATRLDADGLFHCETQNGEALSYTDGSFDAAFSCFGIFLFGDRRQGWREAARVIRFREALAGAFDLDRAQYETLHDIGALDGIPAPMGFVIDHVGTHDDPAFQDFGIAYYKYLGWP